jgi:hypothetical protein
MKTRWAHVAVLGFLGAAGCSSTASSASATSPSAPDRGPGRSGPDASGPGMLSDGCPTNSGFPGDDLCLAPPAPDKGFQLHYGPSDYADPANVAPYVLAPNDETVDCDYMKTPNSKDTYVSGYEFYMRQGSHHVIANVNPTAQADGFGTCQTNDMTPGLLGGSQTPKVDELEDPAPENQGLAVHLPANSQAVINFHVINTAVTPILREAWLNYFYIDASQVKGIRGNVFLTGGLGFSITPGTSQTYTYSCSPDRPVRVLSLAAHMHAHATRLSAWKVSANQPSLVYEAFDWAEPASLHYDSVHTNAPPNRATRTAGGSSGPILVEPGDTLQWECAVDNTSDEVLTFRNEVYTGEMCILTGVEVPADDPMQPYDFTCSRD